MMTTSMAAALSCSHGITISARSGRVLTFAVACRVSLGAGFGHGRVGQCSSSTWAGGELRRRVLGQRRAAALPGNFKRRDLKIVAEDKVDFFKAAGFIVKSGKNALDAGTNLVPEAVPRGVARIIVGVVSASLVSYALRALFSTALFVLAIGGFSYLAFMYVNKDNDSGSDGGGGNGPSGKSRDKSDSLEEARRIMEKYK